TTSTRWVHWDVNGWNARATVPLPCAATATCCSTSPPRLCVVTTVLFTCAGQRVDIVGAFRRAGATTVAADANPLAPALYHADRHVLVPRIDDPEYVSTLRRIVDEHDVQLIVPLTDLDQSILARGREELGALVLLPDGETVERLGDK